MQRIWLGTNFCGFHEVCVSAPLGTEECLVGFANVLHQTSDGSFVQVVPHGHFKCANSDESCRCMGDVVFGKRFSDSWIDGGRPGEEPEISYLELKAAPHTRRSSSGTIPCNQKVFGDPLLGYSKQCYCEADSGFNISMKGGTLCVRRATRDDWPFDLWIECPLTGCHWSSYGAHAAEDIYDDRRYVELVEARRLCVTMGPKLCAAVVCHFRKDSQSLNASVSHIASCSLSNHTVETSTVRGSQYSMLMVPHAACFQMVESSSSVDTGITRVMITNVFVTIVVFAISLWGCWRLCVKATLVGQQARDGPEEELHVYNNFESDIEFSTAMVQSWPRARRRRCPCALTSIFAIVGCIAIVSYYWPQSSSHGRATSAAEMSAEQDRCRVQNEIQARASVVRLKTAGLLHEAAKWIW